MRQMMKDLMLAGVCAVVFVGSTSVVLAQDVQEKKPEKTWEEGAHKKEAMGEKPDGHKKDAEHMKKEMNETADKPTR